MKRSSSYIFFVNPNYKRKKVKSEDHVIYLDTERIRTRLIKALQLDNDIKEQGFFEYCYDTKINECDVTININEISKQTYIKVEVSGQSQSKIVNCLESIQKVLDNINNDDKYIIITSYDFVSEYYCNKMYPKLNELERNLRKLLFNTYTLNYGLMYYEPTISDDLLRKGKRVIKSDKSKKSNGYDITTELFYSFDYGQMHQLLFTPQWTEMDEKHKNNFLVNNSNLSELSDDELRSAFKEFTPKSDWERLFSDKVSDDTDVGLLLRNLRTDRNKVAHCKFFSKDDYNTCIKNVKKLNAEILKAIQVTETRDFSVKNSEQLAQSIDKIRKSMAEITQEMISTLGEITKTFSQVTANIFKSLAPALSSFGQFVAELPKQTSDNEDESDEENL